MLRRASTITPRNAADARCPTPPTSDGPADDRGGDGHEHDVRAALQGQDRCDPDRVEDAGEAREHVREHEVADLDPADVDTASAAPIRFPPTAIVCRPQRVRVRMN